MHIEVVSKTIIVRMIEVGAGSVSILTNESHCIAEQTAQCAGNEAEKNNIIKLLLHLNLQFYQNIFC